MIDSNSTLHSTVGIIGLGYVGLPISVATAACTDHHYNCIGYDVNKERIEQLKMGIDITQEVRDSKELSRNNLLFTSDPLDLSKCDIILVTVPTPIDEYNNPDLSMLKYASKTVGFAFAQRSNNTSFKPVVVFESTVFPGVTRDICIPIIEETSCLTAGSDFDFGYSPERINPGDPEHSFRKLTKVVSGNNERCLNILSSYYGSIIDADIFTAVSIEVAEAAKVIENTQRDLNIALMNELSIIFGKIGIDTLDVIETASTKWNFLSFKPGLVGGHCIGVDPYYLTFKAREFGHTADVILAGRRTNTDMVKHITYQIVEYLSLHRLSNPVARLLVLGISFKGNCPDTRNSKSLELVTSLLRFGYIVEVYDPVVDHNSVDIGEATWTNSLILDDKYSGIILSVDHSEFFTISAQSIKRLLVDGGLVYDLKGVLPRDVVTKRL